MKRLFAFLNPIKRQEFHRDHAQLLTSESTTWIENSIKKLKQSTAEANAAKKDAEDTITRLQQNVETLTKISEQNDKVIAKLEALISGD